MGRRRVVVAAEEERAESRCDLLRCVLCRCGPTRTNSEFLSLPAIMGAQPRHLKTVPLEMSNLGEGSQDEAAPKISLLCKFTCKTFESDTDR